MLEWITRRGWTVDFTAYDRIPAGSRFIEFSHPSMGRFWRLTIREGYDYLRGYA